MNKIISAIIPNPLVFIALAFCFISPHAKGAALPETNGAFYAISVQDIDKAITWYTKHLGFKLASQGGNDVRKGALLTRSGAVLELGEFVGATARDPNIASHEVYGIFKLGFTTTRLDETFEFLEQSGVEVFFPIVTTPDGNRTFGVKDQEGNILQFFENK